MSIVQSDLTDFEGSQVSATEVLKYLSTIKDSVTISGAYNIMLSPTIIKEFTRMLLKNIKMPLDFQR